jgi:hypothetical protein
MRCSKADVFSHSYPFSCCQVRSSVIKYNYHSELDIWNQEFGQDDLLIMVALDAHGPGCTL